MTRIKQMPCRVCTLPVNVGKNARLPPRHDNCGEAQMIEAIRNMVERRGPYYEKWRQAMARFCEREGIAGGGDG